MIVLARLNNPKTSNLAIAKRGTVISGKIDITVNISYYRA